uniref:Glycosyl hydrolase n=1 Tax=Ascaris lumbricoides TaxID=6252 RepID=A0A0M3I111_ASCLU
MRKISIILLIVVGIFDILAMPMSAEMYENNQRLKRQLDLVWSNTGGGFPSLSGIGWDGHIFDPSMQGRYTNQADVMQVNF